MVCRSSVSPSSDDGNLGFTYPKCPADSIRTSWAIRTRTVRTVAECFCPFVPRIGARTIKQGLFLMTPQPMGSWLKA